MVLVFAPVLISVALIFVGCTHSQDASCLLSVCLVPPSWQGESQGRVAFHQVMGGLF